MLLSAVVLVVAAAAPDADDDDDDDDDDDNDASSTFDDGREHWPSFTKADTPDVLAPAAITSISLGNNKQIEIIVAGRC